ncbi:MAG: hypothetical protein QXO02_08460 [Thermofilaceae archaeon]
MVEALEGESWRAAKIVKLRCPHCSEPLVVEVKPGLNLLRCACGGYFLVMADEHNDVRGIRPIEVEKPLGTGRLRLARPELWPSTLEHLKSDVVKAIQGVDPDASLTPAVQRALKLLLELGVLEVEEGGGG